MISLAYVFFLNFFLKAETVVPQYKITQISLFNSEVHLEQNKESILKVGNKLVTRNATSHKCLLVVVRVNNRTAFADASQCPGFATLRKGQTVELAGDNEVNEEVRLSPRYS